MILTEIACRLKHKLTIASAVAVSMLFAPDDD